MFSDHGWTGNKPQKVKLWNKGGLLYEDRYLFIFFLHKSKVYYLYSYCFFYFVSDLYQHLGNLFFFFCIWQPLSILLLIPWIRLLRFLCDSLFFFAFVDPGYCLFWVSVLIPFGPYYQGLPAIYIYLYMYMYICIYMCIYIQTCRKRHRD